jgi:alpha-glucosidase
MIRMNRLLFLPLLLLSTLTFPQSNRILQPGNLKSLKKIQNGVEILTDHATVRLLVYDQTVIRVRIAQNTFRDDFSYAVIRNPENSFNLIREDKENWQLSTDSLKVEIHKNPFRIRFLDRQERSLCEDYPDFPVTWQGSQVSAYKKLFPDERFIGLGEKTGPLDRRGNAYINWNTDIPSYSYREDPLYVTIPFYIGIHDKVEYGIFFDNSFRTRFNFGASTDDLFSFFSAADGEMNYYFFGAGNIPGIIRDYTWLTGRMKLPPYWSLGYQQCRWSYYPESEVLTLAKTFREKKIPCDMIYLDIHYMDNYKIFTWNKERFPDPQSMTGKLKDMGFHLATIIDPGIKIEKGYPYYEDGIKNDCFVKYPGGKLYTGSVWPGRCHFPDFTNPKVRDWWGHNLTALADPGVEGFWNDMNEPSAWGQSIPDIVQFNFDGHPTTIAEAHNVYGLNMARATFEGTRQLLKGRRPFVLTRAAYAGIQRYSAVWTGDNTATEDDLMMAVRMVNSMGVSGVSFTGPDMGGFIKTPTNELFVRWMSVGVYTPFLRNHAEINSRRKEPWSFGEDIEELSRQWLNQRYRLIPYLYSAFYESTQSGMPVARTLAIDYPQDENIYRNEFQNEYLFGHEILVAPCRGDEACCKVYFPEGEWYRKSDDRLYKGKTEAWVESPLDDLPVFVRAGGILPLQSVIQNTGEKPSPVLEINIWNGKMPNSFLFYEDDGITYNHENGEYHRRIISFDPVKKIITIGKADGTFPSKFTGFRLIFHDFGDIMGVRVNGNDQTLKLKSGKQRFFEGSLSPEQIEIHY